MIVKEANEFREKLTFSFNILTEISSSWIVFFLLRFLISLITSTFSTLLKEKKLPFCASCIAVMLACLLYFIVDFNVGQDIISDYGSMLFDSEIWSQDTIFESNRKNVANLILTFKTLLSSFKVIDTADFVLSEKGDFIVFQNFLLSVISFTLWLL